MTVVGFKHAQLFFRADGGIDLYSFRKGLSGARNGKEIANRRKQQVGFGGERIQIIRIVKPVPQPEGNRLLGVLRTNRVEHSTPRSDIAGRGGNVDAIIERSDIGSMGSASGIPRQTNSCGI